MIDLHARLLYIEFAEKGLTLRSSTSGASHLPYVNTGRPPPRALIQTFFSGIYRDGIGGQSTRRARITDRIIQTTPVKKENMKSSPYEPLLSDASSRSRSTAQRLNADPMDFIDWKWQRKNMVTTADAAARLLTLASEEEEAFQPGTERFKVGVTPYYLGLMHPTASACPLRRQAIPNIKENLASGMLEDPLDEKSQSPVSEVIHIYPDRVAFCVAASCPTYCRFCFRKRRKAAPDLHFNKEIIDRGLTYIAATPSIKDVLVTGGDPLMAPDEVIASLLSRLFAIKHVEMIRIGTRTPVTLPFRITPDLCRILGGKRPVWLSTHFNCPEEITPEARVACGLLRENGISVVNQSVFLRGVNDDRDRMIALSRGLLAMGVKPYYVFHPHAVAGTAHFHISVEKGLQIMRGMRGNITGLGIPTYALDTPAGKIPLQHNYMLGRDGNDLVLETLRGEIHREKGAFMCWESGEASVQRTSNNSIS